LVTWIISIVTTLTSIFSTEYIDGKCSSKELFYGAQMVAMIETIVTVFFPSIVTWLGFVALLCKRKNLSIEADRRIRERTLFMYSAVALTLTLTWFCEEITVFFSPER